MLIKLCFLLILFLISILFLVFSLSNSFFFIQIIFILFILDAFLPEGLPDFVFGSININMIDIISVFLVLSAGARLLFKSKKIQKFLLPVIALGILLAISLIRGIIFFGIERAVNFFRLYFYFYSSLLYTLTIKINIHITKRFTYLCGIITWLLFFLAIFYWVLIGLGMAEDPIWIAPGGMMTRVLDGGQTMFLLQTIVFGWIYRKQKGILPLQNLIPFMILPAIIILQQRTVWIISFFLLFCIFLLERQVRPALLFTILIIVLLFTIVMLIIWDSSIAGSLVESALNFNNLGWRISGWLALISPRRFNNILDYVIGQPFGTGYERLLHDYNYSVNYSPHNFYLQTFLNTGGIGLILLLIIYFDTIKHLLANRQYKLNYAFFLILISQLLFYITFAANIEHGVFLGLAILITRLKTQQMVTV